MSWISKAQTLFASLLVTLALLAAIALPIASSNIALAQSDSRLVLTSIAPIFQLTQTLLNNTDIKVANIPERPRSMAAQASLFSRQAERYEQQFKAADAVITIGKIWPQDSLYTTARHANIRIVNIDASKPWSHITSGVAISSSPVTGEVSPYFWTSLSNTIRALNIIARDLQALYPDQADTITANLDQEKSYYLGLKASFETLFVNVLDPVIYALSDELTYFTSDLGIFVDDYFIKQDIDWTQEDLSKLTAKLIQSDIKVVLHKWQPSEEIQAAIAAADAQLLVLNLMETPLDNYRDAMASNLNKTLAALLGANL